MDKTIKYASVVQLVECRSPKPMVSGSSPDRRAKCVLVVQRLRPPTDSW